MATPEEEVRQLLDALSPDQQQAFLDQLLGGGAMSLLDQAFPEPTVAPPPERTRGLRLRIDLTGTKPPVWRRLEIAGDVTLGFFHHILQTTMGWTDSHLHKFHQGRANRYAGFVTEWDRSEGEEGVDEDDVRLDQVLTKAGDVLHYDYDFGDNWEHRIKLEAVLDDPPPVPRCITGRKACPPEDCGGVFGYTELAEWARGGFDPAANPGPLEAWEMRRWLPSDWDPDEFSVDDVNEALAIEMAEPVPVTEELAIRAAAIDALGAREMRNLLARPAWRVPAEVSTEEASALTEAYRILLEEIGSGVRLTQAGWLPPKVVERLASATGVAGWYIGKANREDLTFPIAELRDTAQSLGLVTKRKGSLSVTAAGRRGLKDPLALWQHIVGRLPLGSKEADVDSGWMALAVVGSELPATEWQPAIRSLLGLLGWQANYGNVIADPPADSPTLDVLQILGGTMRTGHVRAVDTSLGATARAVALRGVSTPLE